MINVARWKSITFYIYSNPTLQKNPFWRGETLKSGLRHVGGWNLFCSLPVSRIIGLKISNTEILQNKIFCSNPEWKSRLKSFNTNMWLWFYIFCKHPGCSDKFVWSITILRQREQIFKNILICFQGGKYYFSRLATRGFMNAKCQQLQFSATMSTSKWQGPYHAYLKVAGAESCCRSWHQFWIQSRTQR